MLVHTRTHLPHTHQPTCVSCAWYVQPGTGTICLGQVAQDKLHAFAFLPSRQEQERSSLPLVVYTTPSLTVRVVGHGEDYITVEGLLSAPRDAVGSRCVCACAHVCCLLYYVVLICGWVCWRACASGFFFDARSPPRGVGGGDCYGQSGTNMQWCAFGCIIADSGAVK